MKFILVYALASIWLTGCGKGCTKQYGPPIAIQFGPLETASCPVGFELKKVTPKHKPGGEIEYNVAECFDWQVRCE
jgi:hypothetical protein